MFRESRTRIRRLGSFNRANILFDFALIFSPPLLISLAILFIFFNDINAFVPLSSVLLRCKRVISCPSKRKWSSGRIQIRLQILPQLFGMLFGAMPGAILERLGHVFEGSFLYRYKIKKAEPAARKDPPRRSGFLSFFVFFDFAPRSFFSCHLRGDSAVQREPHSTVYCPFFCSCDHYRQSLQWYSARFALFPGGKWALFGPSKRKRLWGRHLSHPKDPSRSSRGEIDPKIKKYSSAFGGASHLLIPEVVLSKRSFPHHVPGDCLGCKVVRIEGELHNVPTSFTRVVI